MGIHWISAGSLGGPASPAAQPSPAAQRWGSLAESVPQSQRAVLQLKGRVSELEAELAEQRHLRQQAADDSEFLRAELDELKKKREDTEKAQRSLTEIESEPVRLGLKAGAAESGEAPGEGWGWVAEPQPCFCPEEPPGRTFMSPV